MALQKAVVLAAHAALAPLMEALGLAVGLATSAALTPLMADSGWRWG